MTNNTQRYENCRDCLTVLAGWKPETEDLLLPKGKLQAFTKNPKVSMSVEDVALHIIPHLQNLPSLLSESVHTIKYAHASCREIQDHVQRIRKICKLWSECQVPLQTLVKRTFDDAQASAKSWSWSSPKGHAGLTHALEAINKANCFPEFVSHENYIGDGMEIITETIIRESKTGIENRTILVYERPHSTTYPIYQPSYPYNDEKYTHMSQVKATTKYLFQISRNPPQGYKKLNDSSEYVTEKTLFGPVESNPIYMDVEVSSWRKKDCLPLDIVEQIIDEVKPAQVTHKNDLKIKYMNEQRKHAYNPIERPK